MNGRRGPSRLLACALLSTLAAVIPRAARGDDRASAQELFAQGMRLRDAGRVAEACPKFEAAAELSRTPGVRLNLADCWSRLGRIASAWAMYEEALDLAERLGDRAAAAEARRARAILEPELSYLAVIVGPEATLLGLEVSRDGEPVAPGAWGVLVPVDPGSHDVVAVAPGHGRWAATTSVARRGPEARARVVVPVLKQDDAPAPPTSAPGDAQHQAAPRPRRPLSGQGTLALASGALGIAGVAVGSIFGAIALADRNEYRSHLAADGACADMTCDRASHAAFGAGTVSTTAFVAGGVLVATGAILWITAPSGGRVQVSLAPAGAWSWPGVMIAGRWP